MLNESNVGGVTPCSPPVTLRAPSSEPGAAAEIRRWLTGRKKEVRTPP